MICAIARIRGMVRNTALPVPGQLGALGELTDIGNAVE